MFDSDLKNALTEKENLEAATPQPFPDMELGGNTLFFIIVSHVSRLSSDTALKRSSRAELQRNPM